MVQPHGPERPHRVVVSRPRRSAHLVRRPRCIWPGCDAILASDHAAAVCAWHPPSGYRLPHDRTAALLVLHLLLAAYPDAVDLCAVLRATSREVQPVLNRLRRRGHVVDGARRGYVYVLPADGDRRRISRGED